MSAPKLAALLGLPPIQPRVPTPDEIRTFVASHPDPEALRELLGALSAAVAAMPAPVAYAPLILREAVERPEYACAPGREGDGEDTLLVYDVVDRYGEQRTLSFLGVGDELIARDRTVRAVAAERGWQIAGEYLIDADTTDEAARAKLAAMMRDGGVAFPLGGRRE